MPNTDLSPAALIGGRKRPADEMHVVSMLKRLPTNCVSGWNLQPSTELVIANYY